MPGGRPNEMIYGLHDGSGNIFYVGRSRNIDKRMSAYRSGRFHGNRGLRDAVLEHGLHWVILQENPADPHKAEFDEIEARSGLVNLSVDRNSPLFKARSSKPWHVAGVRCPSERYFVLMRNRFGLSKKDVKMAAISIALKEMSDRDRVDAEFRFASVVNATDWIEHASAQG